MANDKNIGNVLHKYLQKSNVIIRVFDKFVQESVFSPGVSWHIGCILGFVHIMRTVYIMRTDAVFDISLPKNFFFVRLQIRASNVPLCRWPGDGT